MSKNRQKSIKLLAKLQKLPFKNLDILYKRKVKTVFFVRRNNKLNRLQRVDRNKGGF